MNSSGFLFQNTIRDYANLIFDESNVSIRQNTILARTISARGSFDSIDMRFNNWGTSDVNEISQRIIDELDFATRPLVDFDPILN